MGDARMGDDLEFTIGQMRGALMVVAGRGEVDREKLRRLLIAWIARLEDESADRDRWRAECWAILLATGADPDGDDARHLNPGEALRAVEELRAEADGEGATLGSTVDALIAKIDSGAHPAEDAAIVVGQLIRWREQKYPEGDRGD